MNELLISAEKIIDCINDGVYVCDRDRRIVFWSKFKTMSLVKFSNMQFPGKGEN